MSYKFAYQDNETGGLLSRTMSPDAVSEAAIGEAFKDAVAATAGDAVVNMPVDGMLTDLLDGRECRGRNNLPFGYAYAIASAGATSLQVEVDDATVLTFVANVPIIIAHDVDSLRNNKTSEFEYRMPSAATTTGNVVTLTVPALTYTYYKKAIVLQPRVQDIDYLSLGAGLDGNAKRGIRLQLEAPDAPTISTAAVTSTSVTFTITKPTTDYWFANYCDIYVFTTQEEARRGPIPGQLPDIENLNCMAAATATSAACTTYKGGANGRGGGTLASATRYYAVAVMKDSSGWYAKHRGDVSAVKTFLLS